MKESNFLEIKFESCSYSNKLIGKLIELNSSNNEKVDIDKVKEAIVFAKKYHDGQKRRNGEPFYSHPLEVAYMVSDYLLKTDLIIASILHDTIEDTELTLEIIEKHFGPRIAQMVDRLTRDRPDGTKLSVEEILRNAYKIRDIEVLLIKFIDRNHNARTLDETSPEKAQKTAQNTFDFFIPLAIYLKIDEKELVEICNKILRPNLITKNLKQDEGSQILARAFQNNANSNQILNIQEQEEIKLPSAQTILPNKSTQKK
jgi:(p)ppGpp synthase/HD superfamily hydrolase